MTPRPLPPGSPKLRNLRYEVGVLGPKNERGGRPTIAVGRFVSSESAREWADREYPDAERVSVVLYSARTGWRPQVSGTRVDGVWEGGAK